MYKFSIGDIVKFRDSSKSQTKYLLVAGIEDMSTPSTHEVYYEVSLVYPIAESIKKLTVSEEGLEIVAVYHEEECKMIKDFIKSERLKRGYNNDDIYLSPPKTKKEKPKLKTHKEDVVYYNEIDNVDECLDAINDLTILHKLFGDESYLQLKEFVENRLKEIVNN